jgi:exodeoxyribonuclease III
MRIATWNVNSLKARLDKVTWWLERAKPDVLLMQETKLADNDVPADVFRAAGYEVAHHGEGRWNGVGLASRVGIADIVSNFGQPLRPQRTPDVPDDEPLSEARMLSAVCGGVRLVAIYAPNGRVVGSPFYAAKLAWYERLARWLTEARTPNEPLVLGGDFNFRQARIPGAYESLARDFGLAPPTAPDSIDHLLARGLDFEERPRALPPERREVPGPGGLRIRLSDHAPVVARIAAR